MLGVAGADGGSLASLAGRGGGPPRRLPPWDVVGRRGGAAPTGAGTRALRRSDVGGRRSGWGIARFARWARGWSPSPAPPVGRRGPARRSRAYRCWDSRLTAL